MAWQPGGLLIWVATLASYGLGLLLVFKRNEAGDGVRFVERYICLGVPAYLRMLCLLYGTYIVLATVAGEWVAANRFVVWYALTPLSLAAFFWWLMRGISVAAHRQSGVAT